ncbi:hypothetical protein [Methylocystis hirsuta]|nr:hypothetical protein [Methylocystis hirsuta]
MRAQNEQANSLTVSPVWVVLDGTSRSAVATSAFTAQNSFIAARAAPHVEMQKISLFGHKIVLCGLALLLAVVARADDFALRKILAENCTLAEAIVKGKIVSSDSQPNAFTETRFEVIESVRGPIEAGSTITYYSFRETGRRNAAELQNDMIVFLVSKTVGGVRLWGTAIDFSEFISSRLSHKLLQECKFRRLK